MDLLENGRQFFSKMMSSAADTKYHGLVNQGATCYLNSVLQVLFMTEDFRDAVKRHCDNSDPELIDLDLNSLFDDLQRYAAYTFKITKKLGIDNVYEQRDAAEYFEKILGLTSREASQIFHGQQTQKTICSTCCTETGSDTPFWNLTLALVNSYWGDYSVVAGIEEYFRDSYFRGENQMYCDACEAKSDATMKCEIKAHPEVLMLLLKRFEFDYRYMTYVKINCFVNVPRTLQIPENQTYELYAVVDHFGDLRSEHYTSTIKPQDSERWHVFNDEKVSMPDYQPFQMDSSERSSSAYLLFYRKKKVHAADTCTQDPGEMSSPGDVLPATTDVNSEPFKAEERRAREKDESVKLLTRQNLDVDDNQGKGVCKGKQSRPDNDQKFESRFYQSHEQPREQERDVKGDKQPKRRDDEHAQIKGASERRERDQKGRSEHVTRQKEVGAVKQARGGNEHIQRRADSSLRHAGSAGSSRVRENRGDGRVKESGPPKAMTGLSEDTMEGKRSLKHSKTYKGKIIEEEITTIHSGVKKTTKTQNIRIKTEEESSQGSVKSLVEYDDGDAEIESEPKTDTTVTLSDGVNNLQLNNSPWKCRKEKNETESTNGKVKKKRKHTQCFYLCRKRRTSESD